MKNGYRYSTEPSAVTMIIGVALTLLGIGLAIGNSAQTGTVDFTIVGALVSVFGAVTLGTAQTARVAGVLLSSDT